MTKKAKTTDEENILNWEIQGALSLNFLWSFYKVTSFFLSNLIPKFFNGKKQLASYN